MRIPNKKHELEIMLTNAQSLNSKTISLADSFISLQLHLAIVTETWFGDKQLTKDILDDLSGNFGIEAIRKDRKGKRGGGVAVFYNNCLLYTSPSPRDKRQSRMPSSA